jgi:hypothetical protein
MHRRVDWQVLLGAGLVLLSALLYTVHWLVFRDAHHIWIYMVGDIAFLPIEVLLVTMVIHRVLSDREKRALLKKLNMVIGAFYSEVGTEFLRASASVDGDLAGYCARLAVSPHWTQTDFASARKAAEECGGALAPTREDLKLLRVFLVGKREFLLRLLENPNLLEHESFTDLLWAVFHLTDELSRRDDLSALPEGDLRHLAGDLRRAYRLLALEWINYMAHLKRDYPYLFSLATRTSPFDPDASVVVP